jgi:hypothetical protein
MHGEIKNIHINLVEKYEGKRTFRIPIHRWENNIKSDNDFIVR